MRSTGSRAGFWNDQVWAAIDHGVLSVVGAIRVAQKVFPTVKLPHAISIPDEEVEQVDQAGQVGQHHKRLRIPEGRTKPFVELAVEFTLTNAQVNADATGSAAVTLAKFAARSLALAEDLIVFQGKNAPLPPLVRMEGGDSLLPNGLLGLAPAQGIRVDPPLASAPPTNSGDNILKAVAAGIAYLNAQGQAPPFALVEGTNAFAQTWGSVINGAPAFTVLSPVLSGGIYGTGGMPTDAGLLVALGGSPTTIYVGGEPATEPTHEGSGGLYHFRTFERVQYLALDPNAFVRLDFT